MLLFYLAATRANRTLTLCYPSLDAQGRPALASHYLDEVEGLFAPRAAGGALALAEAGTRDLDLPLERLRSDRELLAATMFSLWKPGGAAHARDDLAVFPLGFPYLAGPGTILTTILLMQSGGSIVTAGAALLVYAAVLPVLHLAPLIHRALGQVGALVIARILYIFIAAKAIDFLLTGARAYLGAGT